MNFELDHDYIRHYAFKSNTTIVDLGATIGEFARIYESDIRKNHIHLINVEPSPMSFRELQEYYINSGLPYTNLNVGVWKCATELPFTITDNPWCDMFEIDGLTKFHGASDVITGMFKVIPLKEIINIAPTPISLLKADIEGAELEVFMTCPNLRQVENYAIAAYHIMNGLETAATLAPFFALKGYEVKVERIPFGNFPAYTMLYAERID